MSMLVHDSSLVSTDKFQLAIAKARPYRFNGRQRFFVEVRYLESTSVYSRESQSLSVSVKLHILQCNVYVSPIRAER